MVVCKLVRIKNTSTRTFSFVHSGDPWYTPQVDGTPYSGGPFELPPGFDAAVEDLVIPWAAVSTLFAELVFGEVGLPGQVKCVVGPGLQDGCGDLDFIRLHTSSWLPLNQDTWMPLGHRHLRGAVAPVDVELVFSDAPLSARSQEEGAAKPVGDENEAKASLGITECMRFEHCLATVPANTILLNVFDLAAGTSTLNALMCNSLVKSFGAFHAGVEIYGREFSFFQSGRGDPEACGICRSAHPRQHPHHVYRQSIVMGTTDLTDREVMQVILSMAPDWRAGNYSIIQNNCIHFCGELLKQLGAAPVPKWVTGLHEIGGVAEAMLGRGQLEDDQDANNAALRQAAERPADASPVVKDSEPAKGASSEDEEEKLYSPLPPDGRYA